MLLDFTNLTKSSLWSVVLMKTPRVNSDGYIQVQVLNWFGWLVGWLNWFSSVKFRTLFHQCTVVFSSSKSGTLNPALNGLYILMRPTDHNQVCTTPRSGQDPGLVKIWYWFIWHIKRYIPLSARLSVPDLLLEKTTVHCVMGQEEEPGPKFKRDQDRD